MTDTIIDIAKSTAIAQERILKTAKYLLENRQHRFLGENKKYRFVLAKDEEWNFEHCTIESLYERKEIVRVNGWKSYEDLGVKAVLFNYDGIGQTEIAVHPIIRN